MFLLLLRRHELLNNRNRTSSTRADMLRYDTLFVGSGAHLPDYLCKPAQGAASASPRDTPGPPPWTSGGRTLPTLPRLFMQPDT